MLNKQMEDFIFKAYNQTPNQFKLVFPRLPPYGVTLWSLLTVPLRVPPHGFTLCSHLRVLGFSVSLKGVGLTCPVCPYFYIEITLALYFWLIGFSSPKN